MPAGRKGASKATKSKAKELYLLNLSTTEIGKQIGYSRRTISNWINDGNWEEELRKRLETPELIQENINFLSKQEQSLTTVNSIAALTRSLEKLKRVNGTPKLRPKVSYQLEQELINKIKSGKYIQLRQYQSDFLFNPARYKCVLKSRQIGFSFLLALAATIGGVSGRNQLIVSGSELQAGIVLGHAINHCEKLGVAYSAIKKAKGVQGIQIDGGGKILALSTNYRTIQGWEGDVYLDEFAWLPRGKDKLVYSAVVASITNCGGSVTICSTPYTVGSMFWEIATNHKEKHNHFDVTTITIHDAIAQGMEIPGGIDELRLAFDAGSWEMFFECQWAEEGDSVLSWDLLQELARNHKETRFWDAPVYIGVDTGSTGDKTAVYVFGETNDPHTPYKSLFYEELNDSRDPDKRLAFVEQFIHKYHVKRMNIDKTGVGDELGARLKKKYPLIANPVQFYHGIKYDMITNFLKLCEHRQITLIDDTFLLAQFHSIKRAYTKEGKLTYEAKRDKNGHKDAAFAAMMAILHLATQGRERKISFAGMTLS